MESGYYQKEIQKSAYEYQKQIESKERTIVGVNKFESEREEIKNIFKISPKVAQEQVRRLTAVRKKRDKQKVKDCLENLRKKALTDENLMCPIVECVEGYASLGEICDVLRSVWGEYKENVMV